MITQHRIDEVIIADPDFPQQEAVELVDVCHNLGVRVRIAPSTMELLVHRAEFVPGEAVPLFELKPPVFEGFDYFLKRTFDIAVSSILLLMLSPLLAAAALAVRLSSRGPVVYRSMRPGIGGKPFACLKFRTMYRDADQRQADLESLNEATGALFKMRDDPRMTPVGRLLRRYSIDELPQLFNVLRGEMSLVGPRPLPERDFERLEEWHKKRYLVTPGITGLWQVSGRSELDFDDLVRLDFLYLERWSVFLDLSILVKTVPAVFPAGAPSEHRPLGRGSGPDRRRAGRHRDPPRQGPTPSRCPASRCGSSAGRGHRHRHRGSRDALKSTRAYRELVAQQFASLTPENEMKWELVEPERGEFDFGPGDDIVEAPARRRPAGARAHARSGTSQYPGWVKELGPKRPAAATKKHIRRSSGTTRERGRRLGRRQRVVADDGGLRESLFLRRLGPGFIAGAFRAARAADPKAKLYINEIGAESIGPKSNRLYEVVRGLKAANVPIDGVGFQVHSNLRGLPDTFVANMQRFKALGLDIAITEADVGLKLPPSEADLRAQARIYAQIVRACEAVKCASLTFWALRRPLVDLRDAGRDGRRDAARRGGAAEAGFRPAQGAARSATRRSSATEGALRDTLR